MDEDLGDEQWELTAPLFPKPKGRGRPQAEDRRTLNGILWHSLGCFGPVPAGKTCLPRMAADPLVTDDSRSGKTRVWERIRLKFLSTPDSQAKLDWSRAFLDGSFVPAQKQLS
jgi:hypothetical protein